MKAALKEAWVKALRSGEYKQATEQLQSELGYCCLGVLCDVAEKMGEYANPRGSSGRLQSGTLQPAHRSYFGFNNLTVPWPVGADGSGYRDAENTLMAMNDEYHKSFAEIADFIDKNIPAE